MKIEIDRSEFDASRKLVSEWRERAKAVRRQFLYRATVEVLEEVKDRIPNKHSDLKKSLSMATVTGLPDSASGYVIRSVPRGSIIEESSVGTTVLYITAKTHMMRDVPKIVKILEEHNPWTVDTLPVQPDPKTADITSRRVSERVVSKVQKMRKRDRPIWKRKLDEAGAREVKKDNVVRETRRLRTMPDMAFESMRLEFGIGGLGSHPHWRPPIVKLALRGRAGMIARKREFVRAMTELGFKGWRGWPKPIAARATIPELKKYVAFQKALGIKVRK